MTKDILAEANLLYDMIHSYRQGLKLLEQRNSIEIGCLAQAYTNEFLVGQLKSRISELEKQFEQL